MTHGVPSEYTGAPDDQLRRQLAGQVDAGRSARVLGRTALWAALMLPGPAARPRALRATHDMRPERRRLCAALDVHTGTALHALRRGRTRSSGGDSKPSGTPRPSAGPRSHRRRSSSDTGPRSPVSLPTRGSLLRHASAAPDLAPTCRPCRSCGAPPRPARPRRLRTTSPPSRVRREDDSQAGKLGCGSASIHVSGMRSRPLHLSGALTDEPATHIAASRSRCPVW